MEGWLTPNQWKEKGVYFLFRGFRIFFREQGQGPVRVFLHGFPTSSFDFQKVWQYLQDDRLVAPDFLGFGYSFKSKSIFYSIYDQASLVEELMRRLGVEEFSIVAHDYGATVAQELLSRQNQGALAGLKITSIIFMNGGLFPDQHRPRIIQKILLTAVGPILSRLLSRKRFGKSFAEIFGENTQPDQQELDAFWEIVSHQNGHHIAYKLLNYIPERTRNADRWTGALKEANIPMLFINGPEDPVSGRHMAEAYAERVPNANITYVDGAGHYPQWENPKDTARAIREFWAAQ